MNRHFKRLIDIVVSVTVLTLTAPIMLLIALAVRFNMGRPAIFRQLRPGLHGKPFPMYKFRTMNDAVDKSGTLFPDAERVTRLGLFLRASSLDELPELFNVLRGEMSLVGPRPLLIQYLDRYTPEQMRRHEVLPGITGWAQVHGRNQVPWEQRLALDVWYVDHWSLGLDLKILASTISYVVMRRGVIAHGNPIMPDFRHRETTACPTATDAVRD